MASLFNNDKSASIDLSYDLRDVRDWKIATIREIEYLSDLSAVAVEPTNGLVAIGTKTGKILVFGGPPTGHILNVPKSASVKFLQFAALVFKLVCTDDVGSLHIWDLSTLGRPKLIASHAYREPISSLTISPFHSHAFIGRRGTISTYDLLCTNRSPYMITDIWNAHELEMSHSGMPVTPISGSSELMDVIVHPRDLNLLFIAYAGGAVLYDLSQHKALHHYALMIPPGAPGGLGYQDPCIMQARRPALTSLSIHASGQLFATGHLDGTIAFWAVDDEDRPLMVRTIEKLDTNYPDGDELDRVLSEPTHLSPEELDKLRLEPIFKLSWCSFGPQTLSDPYSKDTVLTILGGSSPSSRNGVTCLHIPPLALPTPTTPGAKDGVHPDVHKTLTEPLSSTDAYLYSTAGVSIDYTLYPKENPHFHGAFDPTIILIVHEWPQGQRSIEALEFPPPTLGVMKSTEAPQSASTSKSSDNPLDAELSTIIRDLRIHDDPSNYDTLLPTALYTGLRAVNDGDIVRLGKESYERFHAQVQKSEDSSSPRLGRAGTAWVDYATHGQAEALSYTKTQPHRVLLTHHRDLTIRFQDISAQLLIGSPSEPLHTPYPAPLQRLTIFLGKLFSDPIFRDCKHPVLLHEAEIQSARLTTESCECAVVMRSGHVMVFCFGEHERAFTEPRNIDDNIVLLMHLAAEKGTFQPMFMVVNAWGTVTACEISDIGFIALAYSTGIIAIIDMRHPRFILQTQTDAKSNNRLTAVLHMRDAEDERRVVSLKWLVCSFEEDAQPRLRLLASRRSGLVHVFTLVQVNGQWSVMEDSKKLEGIEHPLPKGTFVLNAKDGRSRAATQATFKEALYGGTSTIAKADKSSGIHCFWISAGEKGVKCIADFTGTRLGKADWGKGKRIECVEVLFNKGAQALLAIMEDRESFVYSLPELEHIQTFQLNKQPNSIICLDDTGDFVDWTFDIRAEAFSGATLGTFFASRRVFDEPVIDYTVGRRNVPAMPVIIPLAPVGYLGSWFNFKKGLNGDAIDDLLAGPDRPIPQDLSTSSVVSSQWQSQMQARAQTLADQASRTGSELYSNLSSAMSYRGEMLNSLEDNVRSLGDGGKRMLFEAKKLAAQQTGKSWFGL